MPYQKPRAMNASQFSHLEILSKLYDFNMLKMICLKEVYKIMSNCPASDRTTFMDQLFLSQHLEIQGRRQCGP